VTKRPLNLKPKKPVAQKDTTANVLPWEVLVVDDEPEVHSVTKMILESVSFRDRPLKLSSAFSAEQAKTLLQTENNFALILLDVVMESDDAGLQLVKHLREELKNKATRIILRTGQPGQAPEQKVIIDYDINDYKTKTELTAPKLFTAVIAALRSYADIIALETSQKGLEQIMEVSDTLLKFRSLNEFASGLLTQISAFMHCQPNGILFHFGQNKSGISSKRPKACSGDFARCADCVPDEMSDTNCLHHKRISSLVNRAVAQQQHAYEDDYTALYMDVGNNENVVSIVCSVTPLSDLDKKLLEIFASKMTIGFQNLRLYENLEERVEIRTQELRAANQELTRLATTDALTGVLNRRAFMDALQAEVGRSKRYSHPLSLLILDIDYFKNVNDTYGHVAGDQVLKRMTQVALQTLRECDHFSRFGGEEFATLLPESNLEAAKQAAERIRLAIQEESVQYNDESINITISIGVAELSETNSSESDCSKTNGSESNSSESNSSENNGNGDKLISLADKRLYQAKKSGRNQYSAEDLVIK